MFGSVVCVCFCVCAVALEISLFTIDKDRTAKFKNVDQTQQVHQTDKELQRNLNHFRKKQRKIRPFFSRMILTVPFISVTEIKDLYNFSGNPGRKNIFLCKNFKKFIFFSFIFFIPFFIYLFFHFF